MRASEGSLIFSMFALLMLMDLHGAKIETGWRPQSIMKSKRRGMVLPLKGQDVGNSWCKMQQFQQTIRRRGCELRKVTNNLCYGQCRSFYIPYSKNYFESCSFCTPISSEMRNVVLNCPFRSPPRRVVKQVKIITACSCRVCGQSYI